MNHGAQKISFVFFGSDGFSIGVLTELEGAGFLPALLVTAPDRPKGRGLALTPTPVKTWALARSIPVLIPEKLDGEFSYKLQATSYKLFVVASYGKIIPKALLDIPEKGALNVHPSLLPKYRGATPIESAILVGDETTGVTVIVMDEKVDHGPLVAQKKVRIDILRRSKKEIEELLAAEGGKLLSSVLQQHKSSSAYSHELAGERNGWGARPQNETEATYTKLLTKEDGEINLADDPVTNFRKIRAYEGWPGAYFYVEKNGKKIRVKITGVELTDGRLVITRVIPEGRREMAYKNFLL